jgi:hypothetical protein
VLPIMTWPLGSGAAETEATPKEALKASAIDIVVRTRGTRLDKLTSRVARTHCRRVGLTIGSARSW